MKRRALLKTLGATVIGGSLLTASVTAAEPEHWEHQPGHVTLEHDTTTLEKYRPMLVLRDIDRSNLLGLYGMVARSSELDTTVCVYATSWATQEGVSPLAPPLSDSHAGDHEWYYAYVDESTDSVEEVAFSAYHWIAGRSYGESIPLSDTHPKAHVVNPWHHYYLTDAEGALLEVENLKSAYDSWLRNGMSEHIQPGVVVNPWVMQTRSHWWRDTAGSYSVDAAYARTLYRLGWFGADEVTPEL